MIRVIASNDVVTHDRVEPAEKSGRGPVQEIDELRRGAEEGAVVLPLQMQMDDAPRQLAGQLDRSRREALDELGLQFIG